MPKVADNRKATFNYEVLEKFEGGLVLTGFEVKSIRNGKIKLDGSYITDQNGELFLKNAEISPYQPNNLPKNWQPGRMIKILVSKKEMKRLSEKIETANLNLIPLSIYTKFKKLKVEFALAKGKKKSDKRQTIKKREDERDILRVLKGER